MWGKPRTAAGHLKGALLLENIAISSDLRAWIVLGDELSVTVIVGAKLDIEVQEDGIML